LPENQSRFTFARERQEHIRGTAVWRLAFTERDSPTVARLNDGDVLSTGTIWVAADGAILRTSLRVDLGRTGASSVVADLLPDNELGAWVTRRMEEDYPDVHCPSTYTTGAHIRMDTIGHSIAEKGIVSASTSLYATF
jgi:hypothetical protein